MSSELRKLAKALRRTPGIFFEMKVAEKPKRRHALSMRWILLIAAGICLAASAVARETIVIGRVVGVHDGDTITVLVDGKESLKIRLNGINAPETKQPFGARAKEELSGLVFGKTVEVTVQATDRYGRTVGRVRIGDVDVNLAMVRAGLAWWYRAYAKSDRALEAAEAEARAAKRGLWSEKDPVAPWDWRKKGGRAISQPRASLDPFGRTDLRADLTVRREMA